jgi:ribose-phosphate pyrophosphokinase
MLGLDTVARGDSAPRGPMAMEPSRSVLPEASSSAMTDHEMLVFTGNANRPLAEAICEHTGCRLGDVVVRRFPDGELDVKVNTDVRGTDAYIVQPTCPPVNENLMELLLLIDCLHRASASRITVVLPYYGYARKDRKDEGRVPITAKLVANLISTAGADRVLALDLQASQIQGFFDIPTDHLRAAPVIVRRLREEMGDDLVLVGPDVGSIKLARTYQEGLRAGLAVVDKRRVSPEETATDFFIGDVRGKDVLLVDDIIATGGSVAQAAALLQREGARSIRVVATHGIFCGPAVERLQAAPVDSILVTDSVPLPENARALDVEVVSVAGLLGEAMMRIHDNASVSSLLKMNHET